MSSGSPPVWVAWVNGARRGDEAAREELVTWFTPFVHGVLVAYLAVHIAHEQVKPCLDEALRNISEVKDPANFGAFVVDLARRRAQAIGKTPGSTMELPGGGPLITEGKKTLGKIRHLDSLTRERLIFRLLEGLTGSEISELTGASPQEVRADLERAFTLLTSTSAAHDNYLWSSTGAPHAAVVPLENQLTPLRYDPSATTEASETEAVVIPAGFSTSDPDVTPVARVPPHLELARPEGQRETSEHKKVLSPRKLEPPIPPALPTREQAAEERTNIVSDVHAADAERTRAANDLPVAAQTNPFANQPGTMQATDLPVAAALERPSKGRKPAGEETRIVEAEGSLGADDPNATEMRPRPASAAGPTERIDKPEGLAWPARPGRDPDPDVTHPGMQSPRGDETGPVSGPLTPAEAGQSWRGNDARRAPPAVPPPEAFSLTRGMTPFVLAAVFFGFFAAIAWVNIRGTERGVRRGWNLVPVTVAAANIPEGTQMDFDMISTREVPDQFVTASVVKPDSSPYIVGQRIMVPVQAGDPLLWSQFETNRTSERLSKRINKHARAFTIESKSITSVGGWVRPGDRVDLIISITNPKLMERTASTTLQALLVLATGKITSSTNVGLLKKGQREYSNVSVLVLPEEIEILALMREKAHYQMVLRNDDDYELVEAGRSTPGTLINGERVEVLRKKRFQTIQQIRNARPEGSKR